MEILTISFLIFIFAVAIVRKSPWQQGYDAQQDGIKFKYNPYKLNTNNYYDWCDGHIASKIDSIYERTI